MRVSIRFDGIQIGQRGKGTVLHFIRHSIEVCNICLFRTLFEGLLDAHPKRVDIWSQYMDMEQKLTSKDTSNYTVAVRLFEKAVHQSLSSKKMKFFFKKYLGFQKKFGGRQIMLFHHFKVLRMCPVFSLCSDEDGQNRVKDLARAFVKKQLSS